MGRDRLLAFAALPEHQQAEVLDHMPLRKAKRTKWKVRLVEPDFVFEQYGLPGTDLDQVKLLEGLILSEGFTVPVVVDGIDGWMEGSHRTRAAIRLGLKEIPAYTRES